MGLKETIARFFHLEKPSQYIEANTVLNHFFKNPEIVHYDFSNTRIIYTGNYNDLIRDIRQRKRYVQLEFGEGHMDIGIPFTNTSLEKTKFDKEEFIGAMKRYGVTFNEGVYISTGENLDPTIHIDDYGFEELDYVDYMGLIKQSKSI